MKCVSFPVPYLLKVIFVCLLLQSCGTAHRAASIKKQPPNVHKSPCNIQIRCNNEKLYRFVNDWCGSPHKMGGNEKNGIDCSHLVFRCHNEVYTAKPYLSSADLFYKIKSKNKSRLTEGDLVFFTFDAPKVNHVGIYLSNNYFVHVSSLKGVMISSLEEPIFKKNYAGGGSY